MHKKILENNKLVMVDETRIQCNKEKEERPALIHICGSCVPVMMKQ